MTSHENPYTHLLVSTAPQGFFGRSAIISAILHGISAQTPRSFSISGVKTIGKTNLARFLCHPEGAMRQYSDDLESYRPEPGGKQLIPIYGDCYRKRGEQVLEELPALLLQDARLKPVIAALGAPAGTAARERLAQIGTTLEDKEIRLALVLDHFDHAYETFTYEDETFLRSLATRHALVLLTERKLSALFDDPGRFSPLQNILVKRPLSMLTERESRQFILEPLTEGFAFSSREIDLLLEAAGGHTGLLNLACEHLFNLHQEYPELGALLNNPEIKSSILAQLSGLSAVKDTLQVLWTHVDESGRRALQLAAQGQPMTGVPEDVQQDLVQTGLLNYKLDVQRYRVFCELFRQFIAAQQPAGAHSHLEEILPGLTPRDRQLLEYLASRSGELVTFDELRSQVWGGEQTSKRAVEAAIHRVRQALSAAPGGENLLQNERGKGYRFME